MKKNLNYKVILFGFIFTFFSSFGQSFFLGLFNAPIRNELGITHGQFGNIYALESLFHSNIHPQTKAKNLTLKQIKLLINSKLTMLKKHMNY